MPELPPGRRYNSLQIMFGRNDTQQVVVMRVETKEGEVLEIGISGSSLVGLHDLLGRYIAENQDVLEWSSLRRH